MLPPNDKDQLRPQTDGIFLKSRVPLKSLLLSWSTPEIVPDNAYSNILPSVLSLRDPFAVVGRCAG